MIEITFNKNDDITEISTEAGISAVQLEDLANTIQNSPSLLQPHPSDQSNYQTPATIKRVELNSILEGNHIPEKEAKEILVILDEVLDRIPPCKSLTYYCELARSELQASPASCKEVVRLLHVIHALALEGGYDTSIEDLAQLADEHGMWVSEGHNHSVDPKHIPKEIYPQAYADLCHQ